MPGDIWGTYRGAHYISVGRYRGCLLTNDWPGLLPFNHRRPCSDSGTHRASGSIGIAALSATHPSAWLILGPIELMIGALALFPLDALAESIGVSRNRRLALCCLEAAVLWPVVAIWGHPEDALAMTFAVYGLKFALESRWKASGWLWGLALASQPLTALMLLLAFGLAPAVRWLGLAVRSTLPAALLLIIPLVQSWSNTSHALFQQPNYPSVDHPTPWLALAPTISQAHRTVTRRIEGVAMGGQPHGVHDVTRHDYDRKGGCSWPRSPHCNCSLCPSWHLDPSEVSGS